MFDEKLLRANLIELDWEAIFSEKAKCAWLLMLKMYLLKT